MTAQFDTDMRAERAARRSVWTLSSVRWAAAALVLFAVAFTLQLAGAPEIVWWTMYLACYAAGGWEPARDGLSELAARRLDVDLLMILRRSAPPPSARSSTGPC